MSDHWPLPYDLKISRGHLPRNRHVDQLIDCRVLHVSNVLLSPKGRSRLSVVYNSRAIHRPLFHSNKSTQQSTESWQQDLFFVCVVVLLIFHQNILWIWSFLVQCQYAVTSLVHCVNLHCFYLIFLRSYSLSFDNFKSEEDLFKRWTKFNDFLNFSPSSTTICGGGGGYWMHENNTFTRWWFCFNHSIISSKAILAGLLRLGW